MQLVECCSGCLIKFSVMITLLARHSSILEKGRGASLPTQIRTIYRHSSSSDKHFTERESRQVNHPLLSAARTWEQLCMLSRQTSAID